MLAPEAGTAMHERAWRVDPYRWVVLVTYMLIQLTMQTLALPVDFMTHPSAQAASPV